MPQHPEQRIPCVLVTNTTLIHLSGCLITRTAMRTHACEHVFLVTSRPGVLLSCLLPNLDRTMEEFKRKSVAEVQEWLRGEKFSEKVIDAFKGNFPDIIV